MAEATRTSTSGSDPKSKPDPSQEPGHYGAGYGEQVPEDAPPQLGPATDGDPPPRKARDERSGAKAQDETKRKPGA